MPKASRSWRRQRHLLARSDGRPSARCERRRAATYGASTQTQMTYTERTIARRRIMLAQLWNSFQREAGRCTSSLHGASWGRSGGLRIAVSMSSCLLRWLMISLIACGALGFLIGWQRALQAAREDLSFRTAGPTFARAAPVHRDRGHERGAQLFERGADVRGARVFAGWDRIAPISLAEPWWSFALTASAWRIPTPPGLAREA
jgi:hypothetical protein